jgi:hypothetical protein
MRDEPRTPRSIQDVLDLWRHVFGDEQGILCIATADRDGADTTNFQNHFRAYPATASEVAGRALEESKAGKEVWWCVHLLRSIEGETTRRKKKFAADHIWSLWADLDGVEPPETDLVPTAVIETSPGHYHCTWRLSRPVAKEKAEELNRRLAAHIGADSSGADISQILRLPGTINHKYEDRPTVSLMWLEEDESYDPDQLEEMLPVLEGPGTPAPPRGPPPPPKTAPTRAMPAMVVPRPRRRRRTARSRDSA